MNTLLFPGKMVVYSTFGKVISTNDPDSEEIQNKRDAIFGKDNWTVRDDRLHVDVHRVLPKADLYFATGNKGKFVFGKTALVQFRIEQIDISIDEGDAGIESIARKKAHIAYNTIGLPVITDDSAFEIPQAGNYPGMFVARELRKHGNDPVKQFEGFIAEVNAKLSKEDRETFYQYGLRTRWKQALAYQDGTLSEPKLFLNTVPGVLYPDIRGDPYHPWAKSVLNAAFVLDSSGKLLTEMTEEEYRTQTKAEHWENLGKFLLEKRAQDKE